MEQTVALEIPVLLPGVEEGTDECLNRLESSLRNRAGILRAHVQRDRSPVDLCLHYDPDRLTREEVRRMAKRAGAEIVGRFHHHSIAVEGMDCSDCVAVIEHSVGRMEGVLAVSVNYAAERMWVELDARRVSRAAVERRIRSLGYEVPASPLQARLRENRNLLLSAAAGLLLLTGWAGAHVAGIPPAAVLGLYAASYVLGGWHVSRHAWAAVREGRFNTDLLMATAAAGAAALGLFAEGALLLFLFSLGHGLEERALDRARSAVRALAELAPRTALVRREGREIDLPVEALALQDVVVVRPGTRIPVDGSILEGCSSVDQGPVTGESLPVEKCPGDAVYAGTINGPGALLARVTRLARDSTLARVMKLVEEAQSRKSPAQRAVERFERLFVPAVLLLTAAVILVPPLLGFPFRQSFLRAMTLLVAASPCALALGAPAAILAGVAQAARNGVLVKGGVHLENLGRVKVVAFDKTGTITHGRPEVTDVLPLDSGLESGPPDAARRAIAGNEPAEAASVRARRNLLALAAGVESRSAHPLARAVVRAAQREGVAFSAPDGVEAISGHGLRARFGERTVWIGNRKLMEQAGVDLPAGALRRAEALQEEGRTSIWVALDRLCRGMIALADTPRPEAASTIRALRAAGVDRTILLTGDNARSASAVSRQVGLSEFRADLLPEDKLDLLRELVAKHGQVAMVGDGVNDAPALAHATVGIAMGGAGTDVALETADVALMADDLSRLPFAIGLGRATRAIIRQNLAIALGVIAILGAGALAGALGIAVAVVVHEGSTLLVVANALRLLGHGSRG